MKNLIKKIDCLQGLKELPSESVDLIYLDPPFFTQKDQSSFSKKSGKTFSFSDKWDSISEYADFLSERLIECKRVLSKKGSIFFHCDKCASHIARLVLESVFGSDCFRSEIIWQYRRWSNSKKGLLPNHQNIYWFTKSTDFNFNPLFEEYSPSTNVDQILQKRSRNDDNVSVYAKDENGNILVSSEKKGVPLSDVWDIPFLNPKAKERTGYPTQKPLILLERIITLVTSEGDTVLDPFFGSGTSIVAAKSLRRNYVGFDISEEAFEIAQERLENSIRTESALLINGRESYRESNEEALKLLHGIKFLPVHRNKNIDAIISGDFSTGPLLVKIQREDEPLEEAVSSLHKAALKKGSSKSILIRTHEDLFPMLQESPKQIVIVDSPSYIIDLIAKESKAQQGSGGNGLRRATL
jgi:site-specific DNA-methyltransferase (adenine-specific)